jgi:hypothetical protein
MAEEAAGHVTPDAIGVIEDTAALEAPLPVRGQELVKAEG